MPCAYLFGYELWVRTLQIWGCNCFRLTAVSAVPHLQTAASQAQRQHCPNGLADVANFLLLSVLLRTFLLTCAVAAVESATCTGISR